MAAFMHTSRYQSEIFRTSKVDLGLSCVKILSKSVDAIARVGRSNVQFGQFTLNSLRALSGDVLIRFDFKWGVL